MSMAHKWKRSTLNYCASGFSFLSAFCWLLAGALGADEKRLMWMAIAGIFLAQAFIWLGFGQRARKQGN